MRDALPKRDRHLRIAPRFFDRDETPAIFVTSLTRSEDSSLAMIAGSYLQRSRVHHSVAIIAW